MSKVVKLNIDNHSPIYIKEIKPDYDNSIYSISFANQYDLKCCYRFKKTDEINNAIKFISNTIINDKDTPLILNDINKIVIKNYYFELFLTNRAFAIKILFMSFLLLATIFNLIIYYIS